MTWKSSRDEPNQSVVLLAVRLPLLSGVVEEEYSLTVKRRPDTYLAEIGHFQGILGTRNLAHNWLRALQRSMIADDGK